MHVRHATDADRLPAVAMMRRFHAASGLPFRFSAAHAEAQFKLHQSAADRLALVLGIPAAGLLLASIAPHPFSGDLIAQELCWWVNPAARGKASLDMLDAYEAWAQGHGADYVALAHLGADPAMTRLYRRRGYSIAETYFSKALRPT